MDGAERVGADEDADADADADEDAGWIHAVVGRDGL